MKIAYIDVQNIHRKTIDFNWVIDWSKFLVYLKQNCKTDIVYYAVGYLSKYDKFYNYLSYLGYSLLFKKVTILPNGSIKGNVDVDIAIRSLFDFFEEGLEKAIIVSNDGDYNTLVDVLRKKGVFDRLMIIDYTSASKQLRKSAGPYIQRIKHLIEKT